MQPRRKPKPAASAKARKPRKPQRWKSRSLRRAASSASGLLPQLETQAPRRGRCAILHLPGEPPTPLVMWKVYKHPKDHPGEYVARKFLITEKSYGPSGESISSRSLRDVQSVLRSLYGGLIQLKRPFDDEPRVAEVWL